MQYSALFVGLTTLDIQYFVDSFPVSNVKVKTEPPKIYVGGPASNAAVAFAKLNKGCYLASASGENAFSSFIDNDFKNTHVEHFDLAKNQKINPVIASVVTSRKNGDRNIFTHNPELKETNLSVQELFDTVNPELLLLDGFYPEFALEAAKLAKKNGIPVIIDCGSWKPQLKEILDFVDVAICSADFYPPYCLNSKQVFDYLKKKNIKEIAISNGRDSIICATGEKIGIKNTKVIDTLGAGDFLHGAFCYYYMKSGIFVESLLEASKVATKSCEFEGTRKWLKFI